MCAFANAAAGLFVNNCTATATRALRAYGEFIFAVALGAMCVSLWRTTANDCLCVYFVEHGRCLFGGFVVELRGAVVRWWVIELISNEIEHTHIETTACSRGVFIVFGMQATVL